uniref:Uncharacterized protein n=1 Tax=Kalanchoe fedtschenkoi TaxID=63787 RepID=A0A7N0ZY47_KALFE
MPLYSQRFTLYFDSIASLSYLGIQFRVLLSSSIASAALALESDSMAKSFKSEHPLERRQAEASRIREKYPDRIPVSRHY